MQKERLKREFFLMDALELSRRLIGKILVHETPYGTVRGIITETEAYMGVEDKGSHTYGGKRTKRTEPMFHIGGTSYVYFIYGMYNCVNVTAGPAEVPMASLIRMVEPADEESRRIMEKLRGKSSHLADGPGKLCIAMHITREDNDLDLVTDEGFYLTEGIEVEESRIQAGKRIGIDYAEEAADYLWRFTLR
ncbi:MAG: DNA-3-methyladenine glycosylase [Lachnospiraceae bacterium]|nr:DNA-3-methyladenine glycosylase [Lachnospiraceae bacterium]